jgi:hypothetical protein
MLNGVGAPIPQISAALLILLEVVGSVALALGVFTRVVAVLMALNMAGAMLLMHLQNGFFIADGGYELVLMIGGASLVYAFAGAGRLSIDAIFLLSFVRRDKKAAATATAEAGEMLNGLKDDPPKSGSPKPVADAGLKPEPKAAAKPAPPRAEAPKTPVATSEPAGTGTTTAVEPDRKPAPKPERPKPVASEAEAPRAGAAGRTVPSATETDGPRHEAPAESKPEMKSEAATADAARR